MSTSLRTLSLHCALALALAATLATAGTNSTYAAIRSPTLASESGWPSELVNRPGCVSDGDYDTRPACEAARR